MEGTYTTYDDEEEIRKEILVMLLSGADRPIKSKIHIQKELFLLVKAFPKLSEVFNFKSHFYGPYSDVLENTLDNYTNELFEVGKSGISLTEEGKNRAQEVLKTLIPEKKENLLNTIKMIRSLYDKLTEEELMLLIYETYGHVEKSEVIDNLMKKRKKLAEGLFKKGVITYRRYKELAEETVEARS